MCSAIYSGVTTVPTVCLTSWRKGHYCRMCSHVWSRWPLQLQVAEGTSSEPEDAHSTTTLSYQEKTKHSIVKASMKIRLQPKRTTSSGLSVKMILNTLVCIIHCLNPSQLRREAEDLWWHPLVWNLRAVIWSPLYISFLLLLLLLSCCSFCLVPFLIKANNSDPPTAPATQKISSTFCKEEQE